MNDDSGTPDFEGRLLVWASVFGLRRWDEKGREAVATALRSNTLTRPERIGLANLIEGKHPRGYRLAMSGQGNDMTTVEKASAYDRLIAIGGFVAEVIASGETYENAIIDAAEKFATSEATVARDYRKFKDLLDLDSHTVTGLNP